MHGRAVVQIRFAEEPGDVRPVAATTRRRGTGARVTIEIEHEALAARKVYVLYRFGSAGVVVVGSARRERVQVALENLGAAGSAYRIASIPIEPAAAS